MRPIYYIPLWGASIIMPYVFTIYNARKSIASLPQNRQKTTVQSSKVPPKPYNRPPLNRS